MALARDLEKDTPILFAAPHPRLGHAGSIVTRANRQMPMMPAVCSVLEPRPTNVFEEEDEYENDVRRWCAPILHAVA
jgi:hypothetical protein